MNKVFENGVLTCTKDDGSFVVLSVHPSTREPWGTEAEAMAYQIPANMPFISPEPETPTYTQVSPIQFKLLFTSAERLVIKTLKTTDPVVEDFYEIIEDPRLKTVDFTLQSVRDGVTYVFSKLVEGGTLTQTEMDARLPQIFAGELV
jgi:hypothetical protein